jgi:hypothetical protein
MTPYANKGYEVTWGFLHTLRLLNIRLRWQPTL